MCAACGGRLGGLLGDKAPCALKWVTLGPAARRHTDTHIRYPPDRPCRVMFSNCHKSMCSLVHVCRGTMLLQRVGVSLLTMRLHRTPCPGMSIDYSQSHPACHASAQQAVSAAGTCTPRRAACPPLPHSRRKSASRPSTQGRDPRGRFARRRCSSLCCPPARMCSSSTYAVQTWQRVHVQQLCCTYSHAHTGCMHAPCTS